MNNLPESLFSPPTPSAPGPAQPVVIPSMWKDIDCEELNNRSLLNTLWTVEENKVRSLGIIKGYSLTLPVKSEDKASFSRQWIGTHSKYFQSIQFDLISTYNEAKLIMNKYETLASSNQTLNSSSWKSNLAFLLDEQFGYLAHGASILNALISKYDLCFTDKGYAKIRIGFNETWDTCMNIYGNCNNNFDESNQPEMNDVYYIKRLK